MHIEHWNRVATVVQYRDPLRYIWDTVADIVEYASRRCTQQCLPVFGPTRIRQQQQHLAALMFNLVTGKLNGLVGNGDTGRRTRKIWLCIIDPDGDVRRCYGANNVTSQPPVSSACRSQPGHPWKPDPAAPTLVTASSRNGEYCELKLAVVAAGHISKATAGRRICSPVFGKWLPLASVPSLVDSCTRQDAVLSEASHCSSDHVLDFLIISHLLLLHAPSKWYHLQSLAF